MTKLFRIKFKIIITDIFKWVILATAIGLLVWEWKWTWFPTGGVTHSISSSISISIFIIAVVALVFLKAAKWKKLWKYEKEIWEDRKSDGSYLKW